MDIYRHSLKRSLEWFIRSGVMNPASGIWGVAERVALAADNSALDKTLAEFPAYSRIDGGYIIEQRRADCNFECAYLFLLAAEVFADSAYREIAVNILDFLYFRSGLLNRGKEKYPPASWNWSTILRESRVWFDDESWCVFLALQIAAKYPKLNERYDLRHHALILSDALAEVAITTLPENLQYDGKTWWGDPAEVWLGNLALPHWGALVVMALARAAKENADPRYRNYIGRYLQYLQKQLPLLNASESSYALLGVKAAAHYLGMPEARKLSAALSEKLTAKLARYGNLPAEHYEAPCGEHLVDTIYTVNWATLALQSTPEVEATEKLLALLAKIQDNSSEVHLAGCWRGMYDLEQGAWGGGNAYEGGAGSIYTGWTNAPIAWAMALRILNRNLFD